MQSFTKLIFRALVFFLPTQLAYHFWPDWALVFGIRVDYLAPAVYLTDILGLVLVLLYFFQNKKEGGFPKKDLRVLIPFAALVLLNILLARAPAAALFRWFKLIEFSLIFLVVKNSKQINFYEDFLKPLIFSSFLISIVGILQFAKGQTLGGPLYFLGERNFNLFTPGISLAKIFNKDFLRAYSTFSHPNSLAGFLSVAASTLFLTKKKLFKGKAQLLIFGTIVFCLAITFSLGAFLALALSFTFHHFLKKRPQILIYLILVLSAGILLFTTKNLPLSLPENIKERLVLAENAKTIFLQRPILGIGLNNFTAAKVSWILQPVHNIYLLVLTETGLLGLSLAIFVFYDSLKKSSRFKNPAIFISLLLILITGLVDHYSLTLQQNTLLFFLVLGYSQKRDNK